MTSFGLVALVAVLVAIFLLVVAALLWQEAKRRSFDEGYTYVVDDASISSMTGSRARS
jgi:ABC-type transporter Mla subunit MlaD